MDSSLRSEGQTVIRMIDYVLNDKLLSYGAKRNIHTNIQGYNKWILRCTQNDSLYIRKYRRDLSTTLEMTDYVRNDGLYSEGQTAFAMTDYVRNDGLYSEGQTAFAMTDYVRNDRLYSEGQQVTQGSNITQ